MKKFISPIAIFTLVLVLNSCTRKEAPTFNIDSSIIESFLPYTKGASVKFLKNGKDTLVYTSLGLKINTNYYIDQSDEFKEGYNMQFCELVLMAADSNSFIFNIIPQVHNQEQNQSKCLYEVFGKTFITSYFIKTVNHVSNFSDVFSFNNIASKSIVDMNILNINYNNVNVIKTPALESFCFVPKLGIVKIITNENETYELIN